MHCAASRTDCQCLHSTQVFLSLQLYTHTKTKNMCPLNSQRSLQLYYPSHEREEGSSSTHAKPKKYSFCKLHFRVAWLLPSAGFAVGSWCAAILISTHVSTGADPELQRRTHPLPTPQKMFFKGVY